MSMKHRSHHPPVLQTILGMLAIAALVVGCAGPATTQPTATTGVVATTAPTVAATEAPTTAPTVAATVEMTPTAAISATATISPTAAVATGDIDYSPDIPDPTEPVVVTFASWVYGEAWQNLADRFHKIHPNITIEFQDVPAEEMHNKLLTQIAANNPPDSAYIDAGSTSEFSSRNALVNLDEYINLSKTIKLDDYVPAFLQWSRYKNSIYGLPIDGESTGLFYRTDRFQEAGLDPNKPPTSWDEFKAYADKLTDKVSKKYGFIVFAPESAYYFYPWLWQAGGDTLNPNDPNDVIWDSPEGQRAADFYVSLSKDSPPDYLNSNSWDGRVAFANGDVAMYVAGAWFAGTLLTEFPDATGKWNAAPLPKDKRCATTIAGDDLVVFKASKNAAAAYKWIEFVSAPENMAILNLGTPEAPATLLPPRLSLLNDPKTYEGRPFLKGFAENMQCAVVSTVDQPRYSEMEAFLIDKLGQAFYGKIDGKTAVIESAKEAEDLLKK